MVLHNDAPRDFADSVVLERRSEIPEITTYLNHTLAALKNLRYHIDEFDAEEVFDVLDEDLPDGPLRAHKVCFLNDIVRLCTLFIERTISKKLKLQIEVVTTDMCRIFHMDNYRQRLLCTYRGPGTQWLGHDNVNRDGLRKGCNARIVKNMDAINNASPFEVLIIKGAKYEGQNAGVVHRSPPIEKQAVTRVLLKIDEAS